MAKETGLRTGRRISHVFIMSVPTYPFPLLSPTPRSTSSRPCDQDRHRPERDRPASRPGAGRAARGDPLGGRDGEPEDADDAGRAARARWPTRPDQGWRARRAPGVRQRDQPGGGEDQGNRPAGRRPGTDPGGARPRGGNMLAKTCRSSPMPTPRIVLGARVPIILTSRADEVRTKIASWRSPPSRHNRGPPPRWRRSDRVAETCSSSSPARPASVPALRDRRGRRARARVPRPDGGHRHPAAPGRQGCRRHQPIDAEFAPGEVGDVRPRSASSTTG